MVPAALGWDDVGDFGALARQLRAAEDGGDEGVVVLGGAETIGIGARATVYGASDRLVALVGLDGVSVVETPDALLVVADDSAQDVSGLGPLLEGIGRSDLR